mmetsp:Transcript_31719/g.93048  ORF Transcript_31719/g.93048 Transcript_31719/m.93048 type:complete len:125 (-) Transcript_31719:319-693(-)
MKSAEARGGIPEVNYGGRKNMSAGEQATNKTLTYDTMHQERRGGPACVADQQSAHDLVVHSMAATECLRQGADPVRTHLTFSTLRNMETVWNYEQMNVPVPNATEHTSTPSTRRTEHNTNAEEE